MLATALIGLVAGAVSGTPAKLTEAQVIPTPVVVKKVAPTLDHEQKAWVGALEFCESRGNPKAINPKDRDGTASLGILQFKKSSFAYFEKKYGIKGDLMNADTQEAIVTQMILKGGINWHQQFPDCTAKLGTPPKTKISTL